jgi:hypothetical protein
MYIVKGRDYASSPRSSVIGFSVSMRIGDCGEAELDEGEKRLTVCSRLKAAAGWRNVALDFMRTQGGIIRFKHIEPGSGNENGRPAVVPDVVSSEAPAPVTHRGGRAKKVEEPPAPAKRRGKAEGAASITR